MFIPLYLLITFYLLGTTWSHTCYYDPSENEDIFHLQSFSGQPSESLTTALVSLKIDKI